MLSAPASGAVPPRPGTSGRRFRILGTTISRSDSSRDRFLEASGRIHVVPGGRNVPRFRIDRDRIRFEWNGAVQRKPEGGGLVAIRRDSERTCAPVDASRSELEPTATRSAAAPAGTLQSSSSRESPLVTIAKCSGFPAIETTSSRPTRIIHFRVARSREYRPTGHRSCVGGLEGSEAAFRARRTHRRRSPRHAQRRLHRRQQGPLTDCEGPRGSRA